MSDQMKEIYYATYSSVSHTEEEFRLHITSQASGRLYAMHPKHAKRLLMTLEKHILNYEKEFGQIKTEIKPPLETALDRKLGFRNHVIVTEEPAKIQKVNAKDKKVSSKKKHLGKN